MSVSADKMSRLHQIVIPASTPGADFRIISLGKTLASHMHMYPYYSQTVLCYIFKPNNYKSEIPEEVRKNFLAIKIN